MNGLGIEEIQKTIKNFICESKQSKKQIAEIEKQRTQLAEERNNRKRTNASNCNAEISEFSKQISELGNQSQELQNKLDFKFNEVKKLVNAMIDNIIAEGIRKIHKIDEEREELEERILLKEERNIKYEIQKQEFYERFGRIPELSEDAQKEDEVQDKQCISYKARIEEIEELISDIEIELTELATLKRNFKNRNWSEIVSFEDEENVNEIVEEQSIILPSIEEKIEIEELEPIQEIEVENIEPIQTIEIEEMEPIEDVHIEDFIVEPFENIEKEKIEKVQVTEQNQINEIEELARAIVEQIVAEQTKELDANKIEQSEEQEIITFEEIEKKEQDEVLERNITLLNIIAKVEDGEIVYKAQISNGEEIKIYPTKSATENALLNNKEKREKIKEKLIDYAISEYKTFDKTVINRIDVIICEVLKSFAEKYNKSATKLIYNYAMSFSRTGIIEIDDVIPITYNFSYINSINLNKTEKKAISKICKNAIKNEKIDIIGFVKGISKIKYILKRLFIANKGNTLPEGKY